MISRGLFHCWASFLIFKTISNFSKSAFMSLYLLKSLATGAMSFVYLIFLLLFASKFFWNWSSLCLSSFRSLASSLYLFWASNRLFNPYWMNSYVWKNTRSTWLYSSGLFMCTGDPIWFNFGFYELREDLESIDEMQATPWELLLCIDWARFYCDYTSLFSPMSLSHEYCWATCSFCPLVE